MKRTITKLLPKLSTIAVLVALVIISIFQYNWVVSSAETDILELYNSLNRQVDITIQQEFNNFPIFEVKPLFIENHKNDDQILTEITKTLDDFRNINDERKILSTSYVDLKNMSHSLYYDGYWKKDEIINQDLKHLLSTFKRIPLGDYMVFPNREHSSQFWVMLPIIGERDVFIVFDIEMKRFYSDKLLDITDGLLTEYKIKVLEELPEGGNIINSEEYNYSAFKRDNWFSKVSYDIAVFPDTDKQRDIPDSQRPPRDMPSIQQDSLYIEILADGVSLITKKENQLTFQWLLILILLIGIGTGYLLIHYQITSLRQIRLREKEFIATISHELRTPLTVIQSAADNLEHGFLKTERVKQYGNLITDQSTRLSSMIEGILLLSRLEGRAEQPPRLEEVYFKDVKKSLNIFSESLTQKTGNSISINFKPLPESAITDRETIELILTNLISNSNKHAFTKEEGGNIKVIGYMGEQDTLIFKIKDNGIGIDKADKKQIFEPFYRGKRSLKLQIKGTGLGLFLSYKKAQLLGGTLTVESYKDKGTTFTLEIPHKQMQLGELL